MNFNWNFIDEIDKNTHSFTGVRYTNLFYDEPIKGSSFIKGFNIIESFKYQCHNLKFNQQSVDIIRNKIKKIKINELYVFTCDKLELIYIRINNDDHIYVIMKENDDFLFVGTSNYHCNMGTNSWTYYNSDGSSPTIFDLDYGDVVDIYPIMLLRCISNYYIECCKDDWH